MEILPQIISREDAERKANKYLIMHVGDGLIAKEPVLIEGKWRVSVVYIAIAKNKEITYAKYMFIVTALSIFITVTNVLAFYKLVDY